MDRGLDVVRAAVGYREALGAGMVYDLTTDSLPVSAFLPPKAKAGGGGAEEEEAEEEDDPLTNATEAVMSALQVRGGG